MQSYQWIKLYIETLDDYKMFSLPNHLWRRAIELSMAAGRRNDRGRLGPVPQLAFWLHVSEDDILKSLRTLREIGIVGQADDGEWFVVDFDKRQSAIGGSDRVKQHRMRKAEAESNEDVTERYRNCNEPDNEPDNEHLSSSSSSDSISVKSLYRLYESEIGTLTATIGEALSDALEEYSLEWCEAALKEAARNNKRSWSYAEAILKRWKTDGFQTRKPKANGNGAGRDVVKNPDGSMYV